MLALAGLAAYRGYMDFYIAVVVAMIAGFLGDQCYFFLGRYNGQRILARFPNAEERAQRFDRLVSRWHAPLIAGIGFFFGTIVESLLHDVKRYEMWFFVAIALTGLAATAVHHFRQERLAAKDAGK